MIKIKSEIIICIACYNEEKWIEEALKSLLSQSYKDFKIVISDNYSTDNTFDICKRYANTDARIYLHRNKSNIGSYGNGAKLLSMTDCEYLMILGAHDYISHNFIYNHYTFMKENTDHSLSYSPTVFIDENGHYVKKGNTKNLSLIKGKNIEKYINSINYVEEGTPINQLIRRKCLDTATIKKTHGCDLIILSHLLFRGKFHYDENSFYYRRHFYQRNSEYAERLTGIKNSKPDKHLFIHTYIEDFLKLPISAKERAYWNPIFKKTLLQRFGHFLK